MPKLYTKTGDKGKTSLYDGRRVSKGAIIFDVLGNLDELSSNIGMLCAEIKEPNNFPIQQANPFNQIMFLFITPFIFYIHPMFFLLLPFLLLIRLDRIANKKNQRQKLLDPLREIQVKLLDIGSNIAVVDPKTKKHVPKITEDDVTRIEEMIDEYESTNSKLTEFLLPGVTEKDAQCHICRSVSRRVERSMWLLNGSPLEHDDRSMLEKRNLDRYYQNGEINVDENILKYMNRLSDFFFAFSRNLSSDKDIKIGDIKKKLVKNI